MRSIPVRLVGFSSRRTVLRVVPLDALPAEWNPALRWLVQTQNAVELSLLDGLTRAGLSNLAVLCADPALAQIAKLPVVVEQSEALQHGDVVAVTPGRTALQVLYRESDTHHTVFLTNRCNSYCLMCSQPPTNGDDSWLVDEAQDVARHIGRSPDVVGFTGGEPLLLGLRLRQVLETFATYHPRTQFDVLTNGRRLGDADFAKALLKDLRAPLTWMVPLYGHADFLHDYIVQSQGAFEETLAGLLELQAAKQPIQLRIVLIEPVLHYLQTLCAFVAKNLPFIKEVALMGCEPIGFARVNRDVCQVDIRAWHRQLSAGVRNVIRGGMQPVLMNLPLCTLPRELWPYAHRSISDWKQTYAPECAECAARSTCSGLFASYQRGWRPAPIQPIRAIA